MPRLPRQKSDSGIYHIMLRGINQQVIFEDDDSYFLTVLRYIHQNPVKAGIVKSIDDYRFSSYNEYTGEDSSNIVEKIH